MTPTYPRPQLTPEARAVIRVALQAGIHPLVVAVATHVSNPAVVRIQREIRLELAMMSPPAALQKLNEK